MTSSKISLLILFISVVSFSESSCLKVYSGAKEIENARINARITEVLKKVRADEQKYLTLFSDAFHTEFGQALEEGFKETLRKVILYPERIGKEEEDRLKNGIQNPDGSLVLGDLKYFFNFNHIIVPEQQKKAEKLLSEMRNKDESLSSMELAALRFSKIIGRDFDLLIGTEFEVDEVAIKSMKYNFLKYFTFAGKELSSSEFEKLYQEKVIVDDPYAQQRFDFAQSYPDFVTSEMIKKRNHRILKGLENYDSIVRKQEQNKVVEGLTTQAKIEERKQQVVELDRIISEDDLLRESLDTLRREYWYNKGKDSNFKSAKEIEDFVISKARNLYLLKSRFDLFVQDVDFKLLSKVLRPNHEYSTLISELEKKKFILSRTNKSNEVILNLLKTRRGMDIFRIARELKQRKATFTSEDLKSALQEKIKHFDRLWEFVSNDEGRLNTELIREEKMIRTALTESEAQDIFRIMSYTSGIRLFDLVKYDPASKFGFCFGRAFFGNMIMLQNGIHRNSIKKIFVYGPMKGGFFGWGFHVAVMVDKADGGFWVLDPSHGKIETADSWFAHYERASKDGRIKLDIATGDRFGRNGYGSSSWSSLRKDYDSVLNEKFGTKYKYFVDILKVLTRNKFLPEKDKTLVVRAFDKAMEMFGIGL